MIYYVYILKSLIFDKTYIGFTDNISRRIKEHNSGKSRYTNIYKPWRIVYTEKYETRIEARKREKYLKSAAGRKLLKEILKKILPP
jgi:putative endonuclease